MNSLLEVTWASWIVALAVSKNVLFETSGENLILSFLTSI